MSEEKQDISKIVEEAVRKAQADQNRDVKPPEAPPAAAPKMEDLFVEGRYDEAAQQIKQDIFNETGRIFGPAVGALQAQARELARAKLGDEFDRWLPEVEKLARQNNVDPASFMSVEQWQKAVQYAKAENLNTVLDEERKRAREDAIREYQAQAGGFYPAVAAGSADGFADEDARLAYTNLDARDRALADTLEIDPRRYKRSRDLTKEYAQPDQSIEELPILEEDYESQRRGKPYRILPGGF